MHTTSLRRVGGSVMLTVPPALLDLLQLKAGAAVDIGIEEGRLVVAPKPCPDDGLRYSLSDLLKQCDADAPLPENDEWLSSEPAGREVL